tara:strand:- start:93 stop:566 length:474 start_codon:yes stop_codon:yes gene_type:complete
VFIGLGSNLNDPAQQIVEAIDGLRRVRASKVLSESRLYSNPPMGPPAQPDYVNAVVRMETSLSPDELLREMQALELSLGRIREGERWGPRTIDLDLLLYDDVVIDEPDLKVPHPGITERAFVLIPLIDIAPDTALPDGRKLKLLAATLDRSTLEPLP